jgi:hypothetical protein
MKWETPQSLFMQRRHDTFAFKPLLLTSTVSCLKASQAFSTHD